MGCICSKKSNIKIYDCLPSVAFSKLYGTITFSIDREYNVLVFDLKFDGWYEKSAYVWPKHSEHGEYFLLPDRCPLTPTMSFSDDGIDTIF